MNFLESIKIGQEEANNVIRKRSEVEEIFSTLNQQLSDATGTNTALERNRVKTSIQEQILHKKDLMENLIQLNVNNKKIAIGSWQQHPDGYPFLIEVPGERFECLDKNGLETALKFIVSSGDFWLKHNQLANS